MNQVAQTAQNTAVASLQGLRSGLANVRKTIVVKGGDPFLRMLKSSEWVYGSDDVEVEPEQLWAANPASIEHGFICWKNRKDENEKAELLGEMMVPASQPLPSHDELPNFENGKWTQQLSVSLRGVGGEHDGQQVLYKTNSVGGVKAIQALIDAILAKLNEGTNDVVPLLHLESSHYKHKSYGRIYNPELDIEGWTTMDVPEAGASGQPQTEQAQTEQAQPEEVQDGGTEPETGQAAEAAAPNDAPDESPDRRTRRRRR